MREEEAFKNYWDNRTRFNHVIKPESEAHRETWCAAIKTYQTWVNTEINKITDPKKFKDILHYQHKWKNTKQDIIKLSDYSWDEERKDFIEQHNLDIFSSAAINDLAVQSENHIFGALVRIKRALLTQ